MFYSQLDSLCKEKGTSVSAVLDALDLSRGNIRRWKDGVNPKYETKLKIANYLKISVERLMSGTELAEYRKNIPENETRTFAQNEEEKEILILCRQAERLPEEIRKQIFSQLRDTTNSFLKMIEKNSDGKEN